ncbi:hypothetical protein Syncc9605_1251 [Synechococcus sp. CC9605]|nr:hypothetical protein Syncc9605_1251 [Synechococcus sp. CC9605]
MLSWTVVTHGTPPTSTVPASLREDARIIRISTQRQGGKAEQARSSKLTELLSQMLKNSTDIHAPFEITGKSKCDHTGIKRQKCSNQFDVIVHPLIIGG